MKKLTVSMVAGCVAMLLPFVVNGAGMLITNDPVPLAAPLDKAVLANEIVATFMPEATARGYNLSLWEAELRGAMAGKSAAQLLSAKNATNWAQAKNYLGYSAEWKAASRSPDSTGMSVKVMGMDDGTDYVYFPVTPCRVLDTRFGNGIYTGPIGAAPVHMYINGSFAAQGGAAAGCGIPVDPAAVALNVVVVNPAASGFMNAWPYGIAPPNTSIINFTSGQNIANMVIIPTCQLCGPDIDFAVNGAFGAPSHVVMDIVGYFWTPTPNDGMPATGRGYAYVNSYTPTTLNNSHGFSGVTNPAPGEYCLIPAFDWAGTKTPPQLSIDWAVSNGNQSDAQWRSSGAGCPAGTIDVVTFNHIGVQTNQGFTILVP